MGKCEHGLTSKECYVCASPKHGEQPEPCREWRGLADEEIYGLFRRSGLEAYHQRDSVVEMKYDRCITAFARAIEVKLKERNA